MGNKGFQIVGENGTPKKSNKKWIAIGCSAMAVISLCIIGGVSLMNRTPDDYKDYEEKAKIYDDQGIEYTYDDYKQDEKAIAEAKDDKEVDENGKEINTLPQNGMSEASQKLLGKNDQILQDMKEETMVDTTVNDVTASIIDQVKTMNNFISTHCGYPDDQYGEEYEVVKWYIDDVVNSMAGKAQFEPLYGASVEQVQAEMRYSILENVVYNSGNDYTQYYDCLANWMSIGHPNITSINTISLIKIDEPKMYDNTYLQNLDAIIFSNGAKYKVHLASQVIDGGGSIYKVLDIEQI